MLYNKVSLGENVESQDLKYLKKHYGENFARLCRELFPTLLETPGLLQKIITEKFDNVPTLYEDILPVKDHFKNYVYSFVDVENNNEDKVKKSPEELLNEAGYVLYPECKTEADIQQFKKYYAKGEELCTFRGGRLDYCRVWFAVKKNANEIKRENFKNPQRQDEYGTSVISIQFTKGRNSTLSIKNRYNHTVNYPDSTFSNNLDNIIPGLTDSFCEKYGINLLDESSNIIFMHNVLDDYILTNDGKLYKSNLECDGNNYCANNNIIYVGGNIKHYDPAKYLLIEGYLFDLEKKQIQTLMSDYDCFSETIGNIKNISITVDENKNKVINITPEVGENVQIVVDKLNRIIGYSNHNITEIGDSFLYHNKTLENIDIPNVTKIGNDFLKHNRTMTKINLPNVQTVGNHFMYFSHELESIEMPNVNVIGHYFAQCNSDLKSIDFPSVTSIGKNFLCFNKELNSVNLPKLHTIDKNFLHDNIELKSISLPSTVKISESFMYNNTELQNIDLPNIKEIDDWFLSNNTEIKSIKLPNIEKIGKYFMKSNENIHLIELPPKVIQEVDYFFMKRFNKKIKPITNEEKLNIINTKQENQEL